MEISNVRDLQSSNSDTVAIACYFADGDLPAGVSNNVAGLEDARARGELSGDLYSVSFFRGAPAVLLVGMGKPDQFETLRYLRAVEAGARFAIDAGFSKIAVYIDSTLAAGLAVRAAVEGVVRSQYDCALLKTGERKHRSVDSLTLVGGDVDEEKSGASVIVGESANFARDLLNAPPSDLPPKEFANRLTAMAGEVGIECRILDEAEIEAMGMGAIIGVAKGSAQPPRVIDLRYGDEQAETRLTFVGKGLTFDSGGLSLKTADGMTWMKGDMGGAAAVAGAMRAIGLLKPAGICVRGLIGAAENMPGPDAMKPGDVLRTLNGKTIEVLNTDAEGRLVLADLLAYAVQEGATHIVDLATLTGAMVIALGNEAAGLVGRPQSWIDQVRSAGDGAIERLWQLPLYPEYRRRMRSEIADMKNTGGRAGGALTASGLLSEFVGDVSWAHLDIAGVAWEDNKTAYAAAGGTGFGVATLVELATRMAGGSAESA